MEQIRRALAKARAEAPSNLHPVQQDLPRIEQDRGSLVFAPDVVAITLNPKTLEAHRIVAWNKGDPRTPAFDILRTKVITAMTSRGLGTLAVTSPVEDCGKTTVAINLAFSMAHQMPSEVVLVDFDLRRPRVGTYLGIEQTGDPGSFLEGPGPLKIHAVTAGGAQLNVVPSLGVRGKATELLVKTRVEQLVGELSGERTRRICILDLPPLLATDDAMAVLQKVDCCLMVVGERLTKKDLVKEALEAIDSTKLLGVVLNRSRTVLHYYY